MYPLGGSIAHARSLPGVDAARIILWGTSFRGGHVAAVGARGGKVAAVISRVPHFNGLAMALAAGIKQNLCLGIAAFRDAAKINISGMIINSF